MKIIKSCTIILFLSFVLLGCSDSDSPKTDEEPDYEYVDHLNVIETIYTIADEFNLKVICDLNLSGGAHYPSGNPTEIIKETNIYTESFYKRFGNHPSFWGWYVNNEINPIENSDQAQSTFWRTIWKGLVDKCHEVAPGSKVTISPFFLLDVAGHRGFKYLEPQEYKEWWYNTLIATGIDIIMLQDSGAEHLSFFTLAEREAFFKAFADACNEAQKELWVNVESAQVEARDWDHALEMERAKQKDWTFTEIDWLAQKLDLASKYGKKIVNWGYYPMMNPVETLSGMTVEDIDLQQIDQSMRKENYEAYKSYMETIPVGIPSGSLTQPKINGTLWYLAGNAYMLNESELKAAIRKDIEYQKNAGFDMLWLVNTSAYFQRVL